MAIKIENVVTPSGEQWGAIIRGTRNPMNSWDKSDSYLCDGNCLTCTDTDRRLCTIDNSPAFVIGDNDLKLMKKLVKAGSDHSKFMRMINVTCDITAPLYWLKEIDTYKVGTVRNSCSTMHRIHSKEFILDDFSHEHLITTKINTENPHIVTISSLFILEIIIEQLNFCRKKYLETNDKLWWWQMIQLLPSSYNQRSTFQFNYAVLRNMYHSRKNHKLDEWRTFCKWIESLPYSEELICID